MIIGSPQMKMILQYKHLVSMVIDQEVLLFLIGLSVFCLKCIIKVTLLVKCLTPYNTYIKI